MQDADQVVDSSADGLITAATAIAGAELGSRRARPLVRNYSVPGLVAAGAGRGGLAAPHRPPPGPAVVARRARKALEVAHD